MRADDEPGPVEEGGDPACWAHLLDEDEAHDEDAGGDLDGDAEMHADG